MSFFIHAYTGQKLHFYIDICTHRLCVIGGAVESVLGCPIEEEDIPKLIGFLKRQEANGRYFSKAMQKEQMPETEEV